MPETPPTLINSFVQVKSSLAHERTLISSFARRISETASRKAFTIMLEYPIPFTPRFADMGKEDTRKVSDTRQSTSLAPVSAYKYLLLFTVTRATRANCVSMENTFAMLSILMQDADASIMLVSVAISVSIGSAKIITIAERTAYTPREMSIPVRTRFENLSLSSLTLPMKQKSGRMIASFIISQSRFTQES